MVRCSQNDDVLWVIRTQCTVCINKIKKINHINLNFSTFDYLSMYHYYLVLSISRCRTGFAPVAALAMGLRG